VPPSKFGLINGPDDFHASAFYGNLLDDLLMTVSLNCDGKEGIEI
jgi:hypothetical protein